MTQMKVFSRKVRTALEEEVNEFLASLKDDKITIQYATNAYYYECCVVYETEKETN